MPGFDTVATFPGRPLALTTLPPEKDRLDRLPEGPCSCLLATDDLELARDTYPLDDPVEWPDGRVAFFDSDRLGVQLGVIERP